MDLQQSMADVSHRYCQSLMGVRMAESAQGLAEREVMAARQSVADAWREHLTVEREFNRLTRMIAAQRAESEAKAQALATAAGVAALIEADARGCEIERRCAAAAGVSL